MTKLARYPLIDACLAWPALGFQMMEMLTASAFVIQHRTSRRSSAPQLFAMGNEKLQALLEASHAMTRYWLAAGGVVPMERWAPLLSRGVRPFRARAAANARRIARRRTR